MGLEGLEPKYHSVQFLPLEDQPVNVAQRNNHTVLHVAHTVHCVYSMPTSKHGSTSLPISLKWLQAMIKH